MFCDDSTFAVLTSDPVDVCVCVPCAPGYHSHAAFAEPCLWDCAWNWNGQCLVVTSSSGKVALFDTETYVHGRDVRSADCSG